ncbi:sugar-binding domain-containing protein [Reichenbachiella ulvae]|uniref:Beta-galactosidase n=1 Tax=Reichenbachiella ulvae TaxID=2980104 RepID=A0ABT3D077_9BACT|nr:sugar-binding domain-containing protein [Reichenbachiella ulvae]MCV9389302.1 beta-galactosidase [Reichenbachiella ulvae]
MKRLNILLILCLISVTGFGQKWQMADAPLVTSWAEDVDSKNPLPEYPRPIMEREAWQNLNGLWEFQEANETDRIPYDQNLSETILVPYPWESALSGIRRQLESQRAWYRRTFSVPEKWKGQRVLMHFGAVDWEATVYINGRFVGTHQGGFDAFYFDITAALEDGEQEVIVQVFDPGTDEAVTVGKQNNQRFDDPQRYAYSPASGIWQTVWLEAVPQIYIEDIHTTPDVESEMIEVTVNASSQIDDGAMAKITVLDGDKEIGSSLGKLNLPFYVSVPDPKLWSPDSPFLYDVKIELIREEKSIDEVKSYVGMRKISMSKFMNMQRIMLNDEFVFQMGPLDQGYWPDGIYTAPTDEALKWDIEKTKEFGYNMIRKHIKVEPQRWYYWCDKMGILVWQDMPSTFKKRSEQDKEIFELELQRMIKTHWNHPSIINWVVFNEHWGAYDVVRNTENVMKLDPTRLVTGNSGIDAGKPDVDYVVGHIKDNHSYRPPSVPFGNDLRAVVNGEYGAIGYKIKGHIWDTDGPWVHHNYEGKEAATMEYERFIDMILEFQEEGLSAAVYTQWTDVENEMNGIYTYDRKEIKLDKERVTKANQSTYTKDRMKEKYVGDEK